MNDQDRFSDELISAFLDGELTADEQALVEDRLVDNATDRQVFKELRALRKTLRSLPRHELGKDLSESVLRRAERAMLVESADLPAKPEDATAPTSAAEAPPTVPLEGGNWRGVLWAAAAVAAVVLLMVFAPGRQGERNIAEAPDGPPGDVVSEEGTTAEAATDEEDGAKDEKATLAEEVASSALGAGADAPGDDSYELKARAAQASPSEKAKLLAREPHPKKPAERLPPFESQEGGRGGSGPGRRAGVAAFGGRVRAENEEKADRYLDYKKADTPERPGTQRDGVDTGKGVVPPATLARPGQSAGERTDAKEALAGGLLPTKVPSEGILVVALDLSPAAVRGRSFDRSLATHEIQYEFAAEEDEKDAAPLQQMFAETDDVSGKAPAADKDAEKNRIETRVARLRKTAAAGEVKLVYVQAPADQVLAMLTDLASRPSEFRVVPVDAGPGGNGEQRMLLRQLPKTPVAGTAVEPPKGETRTNAGALKRSEHGRKGRAWRLAVPPQLVERFREMAQGRNTRGQDAAVLGDTGGAVAGGGAGAMESSDADRRAPVDAPAGRAFTEKRESSEGLVRVVFVLRAAEAPADIAADEPLADPDAAAAQTTAQDKRATSSNPALAEEAATPSEEPAAKK